MKVSPVCPANGQNQALLAVLLADPTINFNSGQKVGPKIQSLSAPLSHFFDTPAAIPKATLQAQHALQIYNQELVRA